MPVTVEPIYVKINFNIPGAMDTYLSRNLLYFPPSEKKTEGTTGGGPLSNYPHFTFDVKYPIDELKSLTREKAISVFFDKNQFLNLVSGKALASSPGERFENGNYNVMCMLGCMFPSSFPIPGNLQTTFDSKIEKTINSSSDFDFSNEGTQFSYIMLGGFTYTVTKALWINDIINNKTFEKLKKKLNNYNDWENKQKKELIKRIEIQKWKFVKAKTSFVQIHNSKQILGKLESFIHRYSDSDRRRDVLETMRLERIFPDLKKEFDNFFSNLTDIDKLVLITVEIKRLIDKIHSYSYLIPREFFNLAKYAKEIKTDNTILYVIEHPEHIKNENKEMKEILSKYKNINQIINVLKDFSSPKLNTSNNELQKLIDDFIKTKESVLKNIKGFSAFVRNYYILKNKNIASSYSSNLLNVGIALSKLPFVKNGKLVKLQNRRLDIKIQLDVFRGIITNDNVKCIHRNAVLEKMYESLKLNGDSKETVELDKIRPYLNFNAIKPPVKQGGKSRKRGLNNKNVTRKKRSNVITN